MSKSRIQRNGTRDDFARAYATRVVPDTPPGDVPLRC
jgi:hypothetical protein